jgi:predicted DNA-binding transcriptional regulator AlpA/predicted XRE-type DNA-binding protein
MRGTRRFLTTKFAEHEALYDLAMASSTMTPSSSNVFVDLGILDPDVELAKADLAIRIQRLAQHRRLTLDEAAAVLKVPQADLRGLFQGRLATCSIDQLLRMLAWLGDDVEIVIRPRLQRTKRGALRVMQAAAVEKPEDFEPVRTRGMRSPKAQPPRASPDDDSVSASDAGASSDERQLLDKHAVEKMTSLDITTIYRKMAAGSFPQPVKVGRRRVAWRARDITRWQQDLEVGTETVRLRAAMSRGADPNSRVTERRSHR